MLCTPPMCRTPVLLLQVPPRITGLAQLVTHVQLALAPQRLSAWCGHATVRSSMMSAQCQKASP